MGVRQLRTESISDGSCSSLKSNVAGQPHSFFLEHVSQPQTDMSKSRVAHGFRPRGTSRTRLLLGLLTPQELTEKLMMSNDLPQLSTHVQDYCRAMRAEQCAAAMDRLARLYCQQTLKMARGLPHDPVTSQAAINILAASSSAAAYGPRSPQHASWGATFSADVSIQTRGAAQSNDVSKAGVGGEGGAASGQVLDSTAAMAGDAPAPKKVTFQPPNVGFPPRRLHESRGRAQFTLPWQQREAESRTALLLSPHSSVDEVIHVVTTQALLDTCPESAVHKATCAEAISRMGPLRQTRDIAQLIEAAVEAPHVLGWEGIPTVLMALGRSRGYVLDRLEDLGKGEEGPQDSKGSLGREVVRDLDKRLVVSYGAVLDYLRWLVGAAGGKVGTRSKLGSGGPVGTGSQVEACKHVKCGGSAQGRTQGVGGQNVSAGNVEGTGLQVASLDQLQAMVAALQFCARQMPRKLPQDIYSGLRQLLLRDPVKHASTSSEATTGSFDVISHVRSSSQHVKAAGQHLEVSGQHVGAGGQHVGNFQSMSQVQPRVSNAVELIAKDIAKNGAGQSDAQTLAAGLRRAGARQATGLDADVGNRPQRLDTATVDGGQVAADAAGSTVDSSTNLKSQLASSDSTKLPDSSQDGSQQLPSSQPGKRKVSRLSTKQPLSFESRSECAASLQKEADISSAETSTLLGGEHASSKRARIESGFQQRLDHIQHGQGAGINKTAQDGLDSEEALDRLRILVDAVDLYTSNEYYSEIAAVTHTIVRASEPSWWIDRSAGKNIPHWSVGNISGVGHMSTGNGETIPSGMGGGPWGKDSSRGAGNPQQLRVEYSEPQEWQNIPLEDKYSREYSGSAEIAPVLCQLLTKARWCSAEAADYIARAYHVHDKLSSLGPASALLGFARMLGPALASVQLPNSVHVQPKGHTLPFGTRESKAAVETSGVGKSASEKSIAQTSSAETSIAVKIDAAKPVAANPSTAKSNTATFNAAIFSPVVSNAAKLNARQSNAAQSSAKLPSAKIPSAAQSSEAQSSAAQSSAAQSSAARQSVVSSNAEPMADHSCSSCSKTNGTQFSKTARRKLQKRAARDATKAASLEAVVSVVPTSTLAIQQDSGGQPQLAIKDEGVDQGAELQHGVLKKVQVVWDKYVEGSKALPDSHLVARVGDSTQQTEPKSVQKSAPKRVPKSGPEAVSDSASKNVAKSAPTSVQSSTPQTVQESASKGGATSTQKRAPLSAPTREAQSAERGIGSTNARSKLMADAVRLVKANRARKAGKASGSKWKHIAVTGARGWKLELSALQRRLYKEVMARSGLEASSRDQINAYQRTLAYYSGKADPPPTSGQQELFLQGEGNRPGSINPSSSSQHSNNGTSSSGEDSSLLDLKRQGYRSLSAQRDSSLLPNSLSVDGQASLVAASPALAQVLPLVISRSLKSALILLAGPASIAELKQVELLWVISRQISSPGFDEELLSRVLARISVLGGQTLYLHALQYVCTNRTDKIPEFWDAYAGELGRGAASQATTFELRLKQALSAAGLSATPQYQLLDGNITVDFHVPPTAQNVEAMRQLGVRQLHAYRIQESGLVIAGTGQAGDKRARTGGCQVAYSSTNLRQKVGKVENRAGKGHNYAKQSKNGDSWAGTSAQSTESKESKVTQLGDSETTFVAQSVGHQHSSMSWLAQVTAMQPKPPWLWLRPWASNNGLNASDLSVAEVRPESESYEALQTELSNDMKTHPPNALHIAQKKTRGKKQSAGWIAVPQFTTDEETGGNRQGYVLPIGIRESVDKVMPTRGLRGNTWVPPKGWVIEADGGHHELRCGGVVRPLGKDLARTWLLSRMGYAVISVPMFQCNQLVGRKREGMLAAYVAHVLGNYVRLTR